MCFVVWVNGKNVEDLSWTLPSEDAVDQVLVASGVCWPEVVLRTGRISAGKAQASVQEGMRGGVVHA